MSGRVVMNQLPDHGVPKGPMQEPMDVMDGPGGERAAANGAFAHQRGVKLGEMARFDLLHRRAA